MWVGQCAGGRQSGELLNILGTLDDRRRGVPVNATHVYRGSTAQRLSGGRMQVNRAFWRGRARERQRKSLLNIRAIRAIRAIRPIRAIRVQRSGRTILNRA